jgi:lipooligosaccharide transport system permease protein
MAIHPGTVRSQLPVSPPVATQRSIKLVYRNLLAYKHYWIAFVTGFFEPIFYLVAVGYGVGQFVDEVSFSGLEVAYPVFLAPGLLAVATMNGAIFDGFFSPFFKLNWMKTYDGIITTPIGIPDISVGEIIWATLRGTIYGAGFLIVILALGLIKSVWAVLALPAVTLSTAALAAGAMVLTASTKQISALEKVMTLIVMPLFLFSGTFYPIELYPAYIRPVIQASPLYHSATLLRSLTTGEVDVATLGNVGYLVGMLAIAGWIAIRLMRRRLIS